MTITVEGPDGAVHEFPDGISQDVIKGAMAKHYGSPTPQQQTDAMSVPEKFGRGTAYGLLNGADGVVNTLGKSIEGADPQKLAKLHSLVDAFKERMGVTPDQYAPASGVTQDANAPIGQRLLNVPRSVVEMAGPAVVGGALGGLPGAVATIGATEAGTTIDRVREADNTSPDKELTVGQKARVAAKVATDMGLAAIGGKATLGAAEPIMATGLQGLRQAATQTGKAVAIDAAAGSGATAADKALVDKQLSTPTDLAVGAAQGGLPGLAMRGPKDFSGGLKARENIIESLDPQSRARVANLVQNKDGSLGRATKDLEIDLNFAKNSREFDSPTKKAIAKAKADVFAGNELSQDKLASLSSQLEGTARGPEVIQALQDINTLNKVKSLDDGGLSNTKLGQALKPFGKWPTSGLDLGAAAVLLNGGHIPYFGHVSPELAMGFLGAQGASYGAMKAVDKLSGASNVPKLLQKYAGGDTGPQAPVTLAKAQAKTTAINNPADSYSITVHGVTVEAPKMNVGNLEGWKTQTTRRLNERKAITDKLTDVVADNKEAASIISNLYPDWTKNASIREEANPVFERAITKLEKLGSLTQEQIDNIKEVYNSNRADLENTWKK